MSHEVLTEVSPGAGTTGERKRKASAILLPALLIIVGVAVLVYPVVSTQWNNYRQTEVAKRYSEVIQEQAPEKLSEQVERARQYNSEHIDGPILDPWLSRVSKDNLAYQEYLGQLNTDYAMSQIVIPKAEVNLPIYHGSDDRTLQKGVGHLFGSALPVGGEGTHAVLTGHTGLTNATLFDNLTKLKEGDAFYLNTFGERMKYQVDQIKVVLPEETDDLRAVPGRDLVTLVTCTPYGINSHRLLVRGTRVPLDPVEEREAFKETGGIVWQWWMIAALTAAALALLLLLLWLWRALFGAGRRNEPRGRHSMSGNDDKDRWTL
ncbi:class C sortase [Corynebacterium sp. CCM 9185]|uniref:Class C sortase n=1 Tax=Corynebacterium marambiense TaxID=2765364 RepID=A0ABS0VTG6_9CORY|nr:class C sortase [Corynebacterium marambiense]MBI8999646.1 class C sortase [Corynebacterium marambiense]MCK7662484.1 class C sortase [Corynebacterium marambiense]MCX7541772.1 class C sortase [Corynebacterium marambiense]